MGIDVSQLLSQYGFPGLAILLILTGVLVPGWVHKKLERDYETSQDALKVERQRNADLQEALAAQQKAFAALAEVAQERRAIASGSSPGPGGSAPMGSER